jgi:DNA processing protein
VVSSFYPFLALLVSDGFTRSDCLELPDDARATFDVLQSPGARTFLSEILGRKCPEISWRRFESQLREIDRHGVAVVGFRDPEFPEYLRDIPDPPILLFHRGRIEALHARGVAIVGTRKPSAKGMAFTRNLARDLSNRGIMIASGCARGIDTAAHMGALEGNAVSVAVLGAGLDLPYPPENRDLMARLAERGCVFSEQPMGTPPARFTFPLRNRLISAVSHAVIVVEAGRRSGARITARWALEQGRDVGAVPGFPGDFRSQGVNALLKEGAFLVESAQDILDAVPLLAGVAIERPPDRQDTAGETPARPHGTSLPISIAGVNRKLICAIVDRLSKHPTDPDSLAEQLGTDSAAIAAVLSALEIEGKIGVDMLGCYYVL